jgi:hypothetical protein
MRPVHVCREDDRLFRAREEHDRRTVEFRRHVPRVEMTLRRRLGHCWGDERRNED